MGWGYFLQYVIFVEQVPRKPKEWALRLRLEEDLIELEILKLKSKPMGLRKRLTFIAVSAG